MTNLRVRYLLVRSGCRQPVLLILLLLVFAVTAGAQSASSGSALHHVTLEVPGIDFSNVQSPPADGQAQPPATATGEQAKPVEKPKQTTASPTNPQGEPPRILGVMPNFRAVSAGVKPPPPTARQALVIATKNSFDYSSFVFVGITSLLAESTNTHSQLGKGIPGFARYYWRGFADKTDGNYMVIFLFPTLLHEDERYYAMGTGSVRRRLIYAATRIFITPNYQGNNTFNASEIMGRGAAQAISLTYYPSGTRTVGGISSKFAYALGRDALTNVFREFWPDIAVHVLHRHP